MTGRKAVIKATVVALALVFASSAQAMPFASIQTAGQNGHEVVERI
jgi:hypothetical protein